MSGKALVAEKLKKTPLFEEHKKLGAKMIEFAGLEMPLQYSSIKEEHFAVREKVGIFDVSHMGQVFIEGVDSAEFLQKLVPQDITKLVPGKAVYTQLTNENGGIVDDLIIYFIEENKYLLVINASRVEEDFNWLDGHIDDMEVSIDNQTENLSMIALQGPAASDVLNDTGLLKEDQPKRFFIRESELVNYNALVARTGYTGEDGFEIIVENNKASELWNELLAKGEKYGLKPVGFAARDTLRLESALLLYGQDMDEETTPVEASISWSVSKNKEENYFGKDTIQEQIQQKNTRKKLVGFKMLDKSIPRHNYEIYIDDEKAGIVTSGGVSPCNGNSGIGLAYIYAGNQTAVGTKIDIEIRGKRRPAEIVKRPFYSKVGE